MPVHISEVRLNGLEIVLPPKSHSVPLGTQNHDSAQSHGGSPLVTFRVDSILCTGAHLVHQTDKPGKLPLDFAIQRLKLTNISANEAINFDAELINPRPVGTIFSTGKFGPWKVDDPGDSAVEGNYRFDHADLSSFKGIAGILNSTGRYEGTLRNINVQGETETADFRLSGSGNATPLHTRFSAKVDGTNGDTWLDPVDATLGRSRFTVQGEIVRVLATDASEPPQSIGHDIALKVYITDGHIEDFIALANHQSTPVLTGVLTAKANLHIPPGSSPVQKRMAVNGSILLDHAQFSNKRIQDRMMELSLRGQGRPGDVKSADPIEIEAHILGDFEMAHGIITVPNLNFTVPGADVQLKGTYRVEGSELDFIGAAKMQATISKMVGGWKGFLLKPADRFFKRNGAGADIPIHIGGTGADPEIGIDFHARAATSPESPQQTQ